MNGLVGTSKPIEFDDDDFDAVEVVVRNRTDVTEIYEKATGELMFRVGSFERYGERFEIIQDDWEEPYHAVLNGEKNDRELIADWIEEHGCPYIKGMRFLVNGNPYHFKSDGCAPSYIRTSEQGPSSGWRIFIESPTRRFACDAFSGPSRGWRAYEINGKYYDI